ncbi:depolymerase [Thalassobaculum fulvum]|uniref:Depolymerase n=1 Tax=Thalassobaculum fulvum TaxID=1633335 RepID=A0A918XVL6_9PROT|nr:hypothetical protein [Thalassobaculum fulvum]GHD59495.1 depolymerase [Thalassobaculum fulvum]
MRWLPVMVLGLLMAARAEAQPGRLPELPGLDPGPVTVSGLSSGAFFAHQMHVAYSGVIAGAGLVAGGPYGCAEPPATPWWLSIHPYGRTITALSVCTRIGRPTVELWSGWLGAPAGAPTVAHALAVVDVARSDAAIDDPANLADDRAWLFSGTRDTIVPAATVQALAGLYRRFGVTGERLTLVDDVPAGHGMPVDEFRGESRFPKLGCGDQAPPFVVDCDRDVAGELLRHLLPDGFADTPGVPRRDRLIGFDQRAFFDAEDESTGLATVGFLYLPEACVPDGEGCRLHVAFHGCSQNTDAVGDDFVWDAGYNRWAEANRIVVLYPQSRAWAPAWDAFGWSGNPAGCWDWWGYSGADYARRSGPQMWAVRAMIARLRAE